MSNECSPKPANRVVTLYSTTNSEECGVAVAERSGPERRGVSRAALYLAHVGSYSRETPVAVPVRPEKTIWSSAFDFIVEGFANCGEVLHPSIQYRLDDHVPEAEAEPYMAFSANERRIVLSLVPSVAKSARDDQRETKLRAMTFEKWLEQEDLAESSRLSTHEATKPNRWNWLTSCWDVVTTAWAHMRREREIRQAIDALAELDDLTLKDIGIHHRRQIEYAVRNGHDC